MTERRVLITGSRDFDNEPVIRATIVEEMNQFFDGASDHLDKLIFVLGGARGADSIAEKIVRDARSKDIRPEVHRAMWRKFQGRGVNPAGFIRNQEMVDSGADICYAFLKYEAKNGGTQDCMLRAKKAGIEVVEVWG